MTDQFDNSSSVQRRANVVLRLLSLAGPEVPPDAANPPVPINGPPLDRPTSAPPSTWPPVRPVHFANEPTEKLPIIAPAAPPSGTPPARTVLGRRPPPPRSAGRAVLVYEQQVRRPWRLWVFTAVLVALTVGVVLGQAEAYQPISSRSVADAKVGAPVAVPSDVLQPSTPPLTTAAPLVTAPLGTIKARRLEMAGASTLLRIRTADLGNVLFNITTLDPSAVPKLTETKAGSRVEVTRTGQSGTVGAEVVLNAKVAWTVRLTGRATDLDVDSRAGGLAGVELAGGADRSALQLPKPKGTVALAITGAVGELALHTDKAAPVRVRLGKGAGQATLDGKARRDVKAGSTLTEAGWKSAKNRYDVKTTADVSTILVDHPVVD